MKAENILQKNANKRMKHWELNNFKITHPTLYITIIDSINEAINYTRCSTQLKAKNIMSFKEWFNFNRYEKKNETECFDKEGILFFTHEVSKEYDKYLNALIV